MSTTARPTPHEIAAWLLAAVALPAVLLMHLLPSLLAGLLVYQLTHMLAARLPKHEALDGHQRMAAVALLGALMVVAVSVAIFGIAAFFRSDAGSLTVLLGKMAEIIEGSRDKLPAWAADLLPASVDGLKEALGDWLREHGAELQTVGKEAARVAAHILVGIIIGAMLAAREACTPLAEAPLAKALGERIARLADAFRRIVFAQVKISALNTVFTAIYLAAVLPLLGIHLPLTKTLIAVTFVAGLIPVLGNLVSNTIIVVVSLSHSLEAAGLSLAFLVIVHKLEYFLNARIVGAGVGAQAWELLLAMLLMESLFGVPGVVAAPIFYAYLKGELVDRGLV
jgi:predicted PurR-regulated permease PerM